MGQLVVGILGFIGATAVTLLADRLEAPTWVLAATAVVAYGALVIYLLRVRFRAAWGAFRRPNDGVADKRTSATEWFFEPRTVLMEIRNLNLNGVLRAEPFIALDLVLENGSGRDVRITGFRSGRMHAAGEQCGMPPTIQQPVTVRPNGDRQVLTIHQPITAALGHRIAEGLSIRATPHVFAFDLSNLELEGTWGGNPLPTCRVYPSWFRVKGPMDVGPGLEPNIIRLDAMFVSQLEYNSEGDRITP